MKFVPLLLYLVAIFPTASLVAAERPNVLLLFIDDLKPMTRDYGHEHMETPNFDRLAKSGLRFENAYCQVPTCGASRASLMTSLYPTFRRFPDFLTRAERDAPDQPTLPQRFKEAGYITLSNGKVFHHLDDTDIRSWSEPAWRPETSGKTFHNKDTVDFIDKSTVFKASKGKPVKKVTMFEKSRISPLESHDGLVAARTMEDLKRLADGDKPFFLACGFAKPHMPFYSPEASWSPYPLDEINIAPHRERPVPTPLSMRQVKEQFAYLPMTHDLNRELEYNSDEYHRHMRQGYYASVTHADDLTGRILDQLEELDLDRNTIVVAVGDHGWLLGEHNEWAKNQLLHEALRTAMWMKGPGIAEGAEVNTFVEFVDIHPTLCELAGISYEGDSINGKSFASVLDDATATHRENAYTRFEFGDALTSKDHYYVRWNSKANGEEALLIDRQKDEDGLHNVAADPAYAEAVKAMGAQLDDRISEALDLPKPPRVTDTPIDLFASVSGPRLNGVVLSHGGLRTGYALHFNKGIPTLSVRNGSELFTLPASAPVKGNVNLAARIGPKKLVLTVNGKSIEGPTSKLLKGQPIGRFSLGSDPGDPVGDYEGKQPFSGTIRSHRVVVGASPGEAVKNLNSATREIPDPPDTPNIVMILADDCTFTDLGVYGGPAKTPHLEALAESGMKFENCFQAAPMCSPTRHNLYTGIYPVKSGAYPNHTFVKPGIKSIAHYLKEQGYRVALTGKTHVSPREAFPFEYSFTREGKSTLKEPDFDATDRLISESKASGIPFCQIICSNEPHSPHTKGPRELYPSDKIVLPEYHVDTPETREAYRNYFAEITFFDGQVGRVMKQLEKHNMVDNTVLIVLSEQGSAFPFAKWTCYDAGLRSGMIVRWPGKVAPGSTSKALVEYVDILPTLLEVAESAVPSVLEGKNLLPVLEGRTDHHKDHVFGLMTTRGINGGSAFYGIRSVRSEQYHLIRNLTPESEFRNVIVNTDYFNSWKALAEEGEQEAKRWVNRYSKRPEYELYEPGKDPLEINNLIDHSEVSEVKEALIMQLESWMADQGDLGQATEMAAPTRMTRPPKSKALQK